MRGHLTRAELELLVAEDPNAVAPAVHRVHLTECDRCSVRRLALVRARSNYLARYPAADFARAVVERAALPASIAPQRRRREHLLAPVVGVVALAAALLLWLRPANEPAEIRWKGGASLHVVAKHAGIQRALRDGDALAPGDQLAFAYALDRPRYLLLLGIDGSGEIARYYPPDGASQTRLAATARSQLPVGIELDAHKGDERLYVLFSDAPLDEVEVRDRLRRSLDAARARRDGISAMQELELRAPVQQFTLWFRKP